jgi:hypothetical protein
MALKAGGGLEAEKKFVYWTGYYKHIAYTIEIRHRRGGNGPIGWDCSASIKMAPVEGSPPVKDSVVFGL